MNRLRESPNLGSPITEGQMLPQKMIAKVEFGGEELIHKLAPEWDTLCNEVNAAPFGRPEWIAAYIRAFEPDSEIALAWATANGLLVAVLPMIRKRCFYAGVPVVKLSGTANSHSIQFDIVRSPGEIGTVAIHTMWTALRRSRAWQVLELPLFSLSGACPVLLDRAAEEGYPMLKLLVQNSPVLRFQANGGGQPAQAIGSRHFRHELRRFAKILAQETCATPAVHRCDHPDAELLHKFFDLEESGWKGRKGSAINCQPDTRAFYEGIAVDGAAHRYFALHSLEANGRMVAGAFSVTTQDGFFPMKVAYDEELRRGGPGHLLIQAIVKECLDQHIPELFFGGTDEHYKSLWTQESIPLYSAYIFSSGIRSLLAYRIRRNVLGPLGRIKWRMRQQVEKKKVSATKSRSQGPQMAESTKVLTRVEDSRATKKSHSSVQA